MTPDLKYKQYTINKLVSDLEGFLVYYNPQLKSWWWINPETKEWRFEFKESGTLYWFYGWGDNFISKYSLEESEFVEVISRYVEHTLQNGVINTVEWYLTNKEWAEHTLQNGVVNTAIFNRNISPMVEHTLQYGVKQTLFESIPDSFGINDTLQNGVVHTAHLSSPLGDRVEHTLQNGSIINQ
jgi:hypothetical protein